MAAEGSSGGSSRFDTLPFKTTKAPGFRFSASDAVAIVLAIVAAVTLWGSLGAMSLLFPIVLGHFFLFCNVFRVRRSFEVAWALVFVVNVCAWWLAGRFNWWSVLSVQTPVTMLCLGLEICSERYHGVGYSRINRRRLSI